MKIALLTAGAGGMYCGSCLRDNTLAAALLEKGEDVLLIPTYGPTLTDEPNVSITRIFYGGINLYLQQKSAFFRHTPWLADRILDSPALLRRAFRWAGRAETQELAELTLSILRGKEGSHGKELEKLACWLEEEVQPDVINLPNVMFGGLAQPLRERLKSPVLCTLTGEDIFLEALPQPYREQALELARQQAKHVDAFIATSKYFADFMSGYLQIPGERMHVVYPGIRLENYGERGKKDAAAPRTLGYLARLCPEKGLHVLVEAFLLLRKDPRAPRCRLRVAGYLSDRDRPYVESLEGRIRNEGLKGDFDLQTSVDLSQKVEFLKSLDVFSVPTIYRESKGLYVLEAMASGVPVVQPEHGSFPELLEATGGGLLVKPGDPRALAEGLGRLLSDAALRERLGGQGREAVHARFSAERMAEATLTIYRQYTAPLAGDYKIFL